jgi:hypothetical protein
VTTVLHLGVIDIPYVEQESARATRARLKKGKSRGRIAKLFNKTATTGDVAEILEAKYHVMRIFFELHKEEVIEDIAQSLVGAMESIQLGAPLRISPFGAAESSIQARFKQFLANREIEHVGYPGVPTQAALDGVNHRLKHPYASKNKRRPSFIDTGLYSSSFKSWLD